MQGKEEIFYSNDQLGDLDSNLQFSKELLHTFNASGLPLHELKLKRGAPLLLMRNFNVKRNLCNETKLQLLDFSKNVLKVKVLDGSDRVELISRIWCSERSKFGFELKRFQFPVISFLNIFKKL